MIEEKRGSIINISSLAANKRVRGFSGISYGVSKAGLERLTWGLAAELGQYNIAVNSLSPSAPMGKKLKPSRLTPEMEKKLPEETRAIYADDDSVVEAFSEAWSFLALQDTRGVTGQRFGSKQLADYLKANGWEAVSAYWRNKLTKAVYVPYDLPDMVYYDTMLKDTIGDAGMKIRYFRK